MHLSMHLSATERDYLAVICRYPGLSPAEVRRVVEPSPKTGFSRHIQNHTVHALRRKGLVQPHDPLWGGCWPTEEGKALQSADQKPPCAERRGGVMTETHTFEGGIECLCTNPGCYAAEGNPSAAQPCPVNHQAADHLDGDTDAPVLVGAPGPLLLVEEPIEAPQLDRWAHAHAIAHALRCRSVCAEVAARLLDDDERGPVVEATATAALAELGVEVPLQAAVELESRIAAALERWAADLLDLAEPDSRRAAK